MCLCPKRPPFLNFCAVNWNLKTSELSLVGMARNKKWLVFMLMLGFGSILVFVIIILLVVDVVVMDVVVAADVVVLAVFWNGRTSEFPTAPTS
jgi:hypothetical protein